jgi:hypothetical protein
MRTPVALVALVALILVLTSRVAAGQAAQNLAFRGPLRDPAGATVTRSSQVSFRIYDAPTGGRLLAGPFQPLELTAAGGEVSASFGPVPAEVFAGAAHWLEVDAGGTPLPRLELETVYYDAADERGGLTGGRTLELRPSLDRTLTAQAAAVTTLLDNGPSSRRIDLVFVGDGYRAVDLPAYAGQVLNALFALLAQEPYATYSAFFNAHRVDVISNESGVDNDPTQGIYRDTAMDMAFWCGGTERLLCVNLTKAFAYAAAAPQADQVFAVANSTKYGGAGYTGSDLATFSGGNSSSTGVAIHELGHSQGNLADEYDYGAGTYYSGPEFAAPNVSILNATGMAAAGTKWAPWLGAAGVGFDGPVSTYEGANYYLFGVYRPTYNSLMRSLGRPFNPPSVENLILEFYGTVHPIDTSGVVGGGPVGPSSVVYVNPVDPVGHALDIQWSVNGTPVSGATQESLLVAPLIGLLGLSPGDHALSVRVTDNTALVRNEAARAARMSATRSWVLQVPTYAGVAGPGPGGGSNSVRFSIAPSPFTLGTTLCYRLPAPSRVRVTVYDLTGRKVATLDDRVQTAGPHEVTFDGRGRPAGLYVFHLASDFGTVTRKALLLR